jgi:hypothetical protein
MYHKVWDRYTIIFYEYLKIYIYIYIYDTMSCDFRSINILSLAIFIYIRAVTLYSRSFFVLMTSWGWVKIYASSIERLHANFQVYIMTNLFLLFAKYTKLLAWYIGDLLLLINSPYNMLCQFQCFRWQFPAFNFN